ncbi:MAG TPA: hypothetical protein VK892_14370 [Pyrinomonadaceae bacterium]|nr:hypothetical protein [Pyrinomonadaceae bacterium]
MKTFLIVVVWIPYAFRLLHQKITKEFPTERLENIQKEIEKILPKELSVFDFRETVERYVGLTLANQFENDQPTAKEINFFRLFQNKNAKLAAKCLNRRNRKLLSLHQTQARQDFLQTLAILFETAENKENLGRLAVEFINLLKDDEAEISVKILIKTHKQMPETINVNELEKDLCKSETPKPQPAKQIPVHFPALTATANSSTKD